jgi:hypothetical protein
MKTLFLGSICLFTSLSVERHLAAYHSQHADKVTKKLATKL